MRVKVDEVLRGDTFRVAPEWLWEFNEGDKVRAKGFRAPEEGHPHYEKAKKKSRDLLLGREIELQNPVDLTEEGQLLCDVYVEGRNVADYFPEYRHR